MWHVTLLQPSFASFCGVLEKHSDLCVFPPPHPHFRQWNLEASYPIWVRIPRWEEEGVITNQQGKHTWE